MPNHEPDLSKSFVHPILGEIIGYDCAEDFYAACAARNLAMGLDADGFPIKDTP